MFKLKYMIHEEETIMKKSVKALLLVAMTVTALAGCSSKPADPTTAATEAVTTTAADSAADTAADTTAAEKAPLPKTASPTPSASASSRSTAPWTTAVKASYRDWQTRESSKART